MFELLQRLFGRKIEWDGTERRQSLRARCGIEAELKGPGFSLAGRVCDLGPIGLRCECKQIQPPRLKPGVTVKVSLESEVRVKVIWVKPRPSGGGFHFGAVFLDGRAVLDRSWVKASLDELVRSEPRQKRRYIRVRTDWVVQATAGGQEAELRVKDLSVTGARLESKEPYAVGETLQLQLDTMRVEAEVRRLTQHGLGYTLGVRFKSSDPQTQQLLNLVRKLCS